MAKPVVENTGPIDLAFEHMLKSFTSQVKRDGVLDEVKRRRYYTKPSAEKREYKKSKEKR
jgi:ribosomal protein S21